MEHSRRTFVRRMTLVGAGIAASSSVLARAASCSPTTRQGAVFVEQPPAELAFELGVPASVPYGRAHHPDGRPLAAGLDALPPGFSITLAGDQIMLHWDGRGETGTYHVRAFLDDGV